MYYDIYDKIPFHSSRDLSWWRQLHPYQAFIRTKNVNEVPDFFDAVEAIALTKLLNGNKVQIWHQYYKLDAIVDFLIANNLSATSRKKNMPDWTPYLHMAKGNDAARLLALQKLISQQKHRIVTDDDTTLSLVPTLKQAGMSVCEPQIWEYAVVLPVSEVTVKSVVSSEDPDGISYPAVIANYASRDGICFEVDTYDGMALDVAVKQTLQKLEGNAFDSAFIQENEEGKLTQLATYIIDNAIRKGKKAVKEAGIDGIEMICFKYEGAYHWGLFVPNGTEVSNETIETIIEAATPAEFLPAQ